MKYVTTKKIRLHFQFKTFHVMYVDYLCPLRKVIQVYKLPCERTENTAFIS